MSLSDVFHDALRIHFSNASAGGTEPSKLLMAREDFLARIHYSWFSEMLQPLPKEEQSLLKAALPSNIIDRLGGKSLPFSNIFQNKLAEKMGLYSYPSLFVATKGPFFSLLDLDKESIIDIISLLPFPLLSPQVKKIVDKKRLLALYSLLTDAQRDLLKQMLIRPDQGTINDFNLSTWQGSSTDLELKIHKTGIELLSQATRGEGESFRFYLSRILDRGRGKMYLEAQESPIAKDPVGLLHAVLKYYNQRKSHAPTKT